MLPGVVNGTKLQLPVCVVIVLVTSLDTAPGWTCQVSLIDRTKNYGLLGDD